MLVFELVKDNEKYIYRLPQSAAEVTVGKFIQYQNTVETKKPESLKQYEELETDEQRKEFIAGVEESEINTSWVSYYMKEIGFWCNMKAEHMALLPVKINGEPLPGEMDLFGLRSMLHKAFSVPEVKEEDVESFKINGSRFYLPEKRPALIGNTDDYLRTTTIGEFATASELRRVFNKQLEGSVEGLLYLIAVLCRKKNEVFPVIPDEQTEFIRQRFEELKDIDLQTALKVGFFLSLHKMPLQAVFRCFPEVQEVLEKAQQAKSMAII